MDSDPDLMERFWVSLIVIGLPVGVQNRIYRKEIVTVGALLDKVNQLEFRSKKRSEKAMGKK